MLMAEHERIKRIPGGIVIERIRDNAVIEKTTVRTTATQVLRLLHNNGITRSHWEAAERYAELWRHAGFEPRVQGLAMDAVIVDGGQSKMREPYTGRDSAVDTLDRIERESLGRDERKVIEHVACLDCSVRKTAWILQIDRRLVKRILRKGLEGVAWWFKRQDRGRRGA